MTEHYYLLCNECGEYFEWDEELDKSEWACRACGSKDMEELWTEARVAALAKFLCVSPYDIEEGYGDCMLKDGKQEYIVATDAEADELWDEALESYIDECILYQLPEIYRSYFDREGWKGDARMDGRGHSLNYYDGSEEMVTVDCEDFYIYRRN